MEDYSNDISKCPFHNDSMDNVTATGTKNSNW
jgi:catalase-peroxidase